MSLNSNNDKIEKIVTDNGSNMVKMGKLINLEGDDEFDVYDSENLNLDSDEDEDSKIAISDDETYSRPFEFKT
ncbi:hypothetical protein BpHYR1_000044 [Brachionus plicatilis]|uniref:Uncharacterized protein n=1 Tax=Brachionus plicatilis TaxID=10195 RepID=A0A3M7QJ98_BRAPC|nr:hypothetical protein BpHYR1_000044 [Brachionus plicatilis]